VQVQDATIARLQRKADDYDVLARALGEHVDLADALYDRLGAKPA
jgi:hypothetical protein